MISPTEVLNMHFFRAATGRQSDWPVCRSAARQPTNLPPLFDRLFFLLLSFSLCFFLFLSQRRS